jgi:hypothetical protein
MEFKLNKAQRLVTHATAKDTSRPILNNVHIRKGLIEASNGWLIIRKRINYDGYEELLLNSKDIASCRDEAWGAYSQCLPEPDTCVHFKTTAEGVQAEGKQKLILQPQQGNFPNVDKLYPLTSEETISRLAGREPACKFKIALKKRDLLALLNSLAEDEDTIRFFFYGEQSVVKFQVGKEVEGLLMPMQVQWE